MNKFPHLIVTLALILLSFICQAGSNEKSELIERSTSINVNGQIQVDDHPHSMPQIVVSDIPGGVIKVTRNAIPDKSHDTDFFKLKGNWYKVSATTAVISTDGDGNTTVKSAGLFFDSIVAKYAPPTVYDIQNPPDYWLNHGGNRYKAHDYLNDLIRQGLLKPQDFLDPRNSDAH